MAKTKQIGRYIIDEKGHITRLDKKVAIQIPKSILTPLPKLPEKPTDEQIFNWERMYEFIEERNYVRGYVYVRAMRAKERKLAFAYYKQEALARKQAVFKFVREMLGIKTRE